MTNFRLTIAYDGTRYSGWQRQGTTDRTIQGRLEEALGRMVGHRVELNGAGRTDAGVHARAQVASIPLNTDLTPDEVRAFLNRDLPEDIAVIACEAADPRFHARLNATGKRYCYRFWDGDCANVFERRYLWRTPPLDEAAMARAAELLIGRHDFRAFCGNRRMKKSTERTLWRAEVVRLGDEVRLTCEGTGFLQNMMRIIAGTLAEVGQGIRSPEDLAAVLESRDRDRAGPTAPACGLILDTVFYDRRDLP